MNCTQPVALITGAASGLGWALAEQLCQKNYALVLVDLNSELGNGTQVTIWLPVHDENNPLAAVHDSSGTSLRDH